MSEMTNGSFNQISTNLRQSGSFFEVEDSFGGAGDNLKKALVIVPMLDAGTATEGSITVITGDGASAKTLFGLVAYDIAKAFRKVNNTSPLFMVGQKDAAGSAAATTDRTFASNAGENASLRVSLGRKYLHLSVLKDDTPTEVAAAIVVAINAADWEVTASSNAAVLTVTCDHKGEIGNDLYFEITGLPSGMTVTANGFLSGGTVNPLPAGIVATMGDKEYDYVGTCFHDDVYLEALDDEFERREGPDAMVYGAGYFALRGTVSEQYTFSGDGVKNWKYMTRMPVLPSQRIPEWIMMAQYLARAAQSLTNHPSRPMQTLTFPDIDAPSEAELLAFADFTLLLYSGCSTWKVGPGGVVYIDRAITHNQKDISGNPTVARMDIMVNYQIALINRKLKALIDSEYIQRRLILLDNGTEVNAGVPATTPTSIKGRIVSEAEDLRADGHMENIPAFEKLMLVTKEGSRLNMRLNPDLPNPFVNAAIQIGFSLDWPDDLTALSL